MANPRLSSKLPLFFAIALSAHAQSGRSPKSLTEGPPALTKNDISSANYVEFKTKRLKNAWTAWIDADWFREQGVDVPADGLANPKFHKEVTDAFAFQVPHPDDDPASFLDETKSWYADYYGGYGTSQNKGSARAGSAGLVNMKGIGQTPHLNSTDRYHSNGAAKSIEGIDEAIWGKILNNELPYGSNRVVALVFTGTFGKLPPNNPGDPEEIFPRILIVREDDLRPASFQTNIRVEKEIETKRLASIRNYFAKNLPLPPGAKPQSEGERIRIGFNELIDRRADQYAAHFSRRFYHGSTSPSNLGISGKDLDLGDQTAQPGFAKIVKLKGESPFGETQSQIDIFDDLLDDLPHTLTAEQAAFLPSHEEARSRFTERFHVSRAREMLEAAGFPPETARAVRDEPALRRLGDLLVDIATAGADTPIWLDGNPIPNPNRYDFTAIVTQLADSYASNSEPTALSKRLEGALPSLIPEQNLRSALASVYAEATGKAQKISAASNVGTAAFAEYLFHASRVRNNPRPSLYRGHQRWKELWNTSDEAALRGNRASISEYVEKITWENVRTIRGLKPYQVLIGLEVHADSGNELRRIFDARKGKEITVLRVDAANEQAHFFGASVGRSELAHATLRAPDGSVAGARKQGRWIEFELPTNAAVHAEDLRLTTGTRIVAPDRSILSKIVGWKASNKGVPGSQLRRCQDVLSKVVLSGL